MWGNILWCVIGLIVGLVVGFLGARAFMKKYLKKNPPINEKMIKIGISCISVSGA